MDAIVPSFYRTKFGVSTSASQKNYVKKLDPVLSSIVN